MKNAPLVESKKTTLGQTGRTWLMAVGLGLAVFAPIAALADMPSSGVPFKQALSDARQVAAMNPTWHVFAAHGESMEPQFGSASLLLVSESAYESLQAGMVVVYRDGTGDLVAHRLIQLTATGWVVKGVNNDRPDPGLVTAQNLQGVVFGILHYQADSDALAMAGPVARPDVAYAKRY